jgi:type VI secretion system protein VasG
MLNLNLRALMNRLNAYCTRALETAAGVCVSRGSYEIAVEHLLLALIEEPDRDFQAILRHFEVDPSRVEKALHGLVEEGRTGNPGKPVFSPLLIEWLQDAWMVGSVELELGELRSGLLITALMMNPGRYVPGDLFDELQPLSSDELRRHFHDIVAGSKEDTVLARKGQARAAGDQPRDQTALGKFTVDFTGQARAGKIDPVFCRDREIRQMIDILGRRRKNNPIAVGEAGVGKTAVVEGLALKIVEGDVPEVLQNVEILGLDLGLLQAGAGVKGEFESRLKAVIDEVKASPKPIILFIDEAHTLIGAGGSAGSGDAANLLKPELARGELRTVAATTWSEYKKYFEKDPALARRFQPVKLDEPSPSDAVTIIRGLRSRYEEAHGVYVRDDAVQAAATLAARYISGRQLPDKAVDVLDTAAARVKISVTSKPDRLDDMERRLKSLERERDALERDAEAGIETDVEHMAELQQGIAALQGDIEQLALRWEKERDQVNKVLDLRRRIAAAVDGSGGPAEVAAADENVTTEAGGEAAATPEAGTAPEAVDLGTLKTELVKAEAALDEIQGDQALIHHEVSPEVVAKVIGDWTGIPIGKMVKDEAKTILTFRQSLGGRIKGQDHALEAIDRSIRSAKAALGNPAAPIGVFLLVGPSGVGKTETATAVADLLFGGEQFMTTINMSEFQEKHTVSRLIGSPPGYVGYGEGGKLTEAVRQRPYSVVLLDEVEKADLEVMNLFYQVFDKGMLSDGEGRNIDFRNTILFLTSNLASDVISELASGDEPMDPDAVMTAIRPILNQHFQPALLARMEVVPFLPIAGAAMGEIVGLKLNRFGDRLRQNHRMSFSWEPAVVDQIVQRCTEVETGARNIDYIVNRNLLPRVATELLEEMGAERSPTGLTVGIAEDGEFTLTFAHAE